MRRRCQLVSLATFTFLLSLGAPQFPTFSFLPAAAQTSQDRKAEADYTYKTAEGMLFVTSFLWGLASRIFPVTNNIPSAVL